MTLVKIDLCERVISDKALEEIKERKVVYGEDQDLLRQDLDLCATPEERYKRFCLVNPDKISFVADNFEIDQNGSLTADIRPLDPDVNNLLDKGHFGIRALVSNVPNANGEIIPSIDKVISIDWISNTVSLPE